MAIAVNGGHIARALDFYNTPGKYFIIGGTQAWTNGDANPINPKAGDYKLEGIIGLKKVDNIQMVVPVPESEAESGKQYIQYRNQKWRTVTPLVETTITNNNGISVGTKQMTVGSVDGLTAGSRVRIGNLYEAKITAVNGLQLSLDTGAPQFIPQGTEVLGGAHVEGAKYVYVECSLNYDAFPLQTYRQIGLCTKVTHGAGVEETKDVIKATDSDFSNTQLGILEILDNRAASPRDENQRELLSLIVEF